ncbi:MAG: GNAT family N-acetyltransferase [Bdellovibrionales bacterium]|nr:GNAT family N-acetyltransferase [Bdellovibrionales bacterium]
MIIKEVSDISYAKTISNFQIQMALETENLKLDPETVLEGVKAVFLDSSKGHYVVCEDDDQVVASLLIMNEWSDWRNGNVIWVHSVFVLPEYRGQKVFAKMYAFLQGKVKRDSSLRGIRLYVDKTNIPAQSVYKKIGMNNDHYDLYEWMAK